MCIAEGRLVAQYDPNAPEDKRVTYVVFVGYKNGKPQFRDLTPDEQVRLDARRK